MAVGFPAEDGTTRMNATPEQRIAALENEVRGLKNLLGAQKRTPNRPEALTPPPRRDEPQVRVTSPPLAKVELPSEGEFRRLLEIVLTRYPQLRPRANSLDHSGKVQGWLFIRLAHCGEAQQGDRQSALALVLARDDCQEWCRHHQINPNNGFTGAGAIYGGCDRARRYSALCRGLGRTIFLRSCQFGGGGADP